MEGRKWTISSDGGEEADDFAVMIIRIVCVFFTLLRYYVSSMFVSSLPVIYFFQINKNLRK